MSLLSLFFTFAYIGLITIGGGLVAVPIMQDILVGKNLITNEAFFNMLAISESTPGPIGVNMATYLGYEMHGIVGGIVTTAGMVMPSLICILVIAKWFIHATEHRIVKNAFYGLRVGVAAMIASVTWTVLQITVIDIAVLQKAGPEYKGVFLLDFINVPSLFFYVAALVVLFKTKLHPIAIVAAGAVFGVVAL